MGLNVNEREKMEKLKNLIKENDVISFDIFDTLLIREFLYPIDVFKYIEDHHNLSDFQKKRIFFEADTRKIYCEDEDITYTNLYKNLPEIDKKIELEVEYSACIVNPTMYALYQYALEQKKKVIAISDMYLEQEFIESLLEKNGYNEISNIYVSSNIKTTKSSGNSYKYVVDMLKIEKRKILHIGDNHHADFLMSMDNGLNAFHYVSKREKFIQERNGSLLQEIEKCNTPISSVYGALLSNSFETRKHEGYWYNFGYEYAGISVYEFVKWVYAYAQKNNLTRLYFMARDGHIMKEVFDKLYPNENIKTYYIFSSRRMFFFPSITKLDDTTFNFLLTGSVDTTIIEYIDRLEIPELSKKALAYFRTIKKVVKTNKDKEELKIFFLKEEQLILEEARHEKKELIQYLEGIEFFKDNLKAIVDVGWGSSSQKYLESIIESKIHGLYFGTHDKTYWHKDIHGFLFSKGKPQANMELVLKSLEVVELLFLGVHASIAKVENNMPIYHELCDNENFRIKIGKEAHRGTIFFINEFESIIKKYNLTESSVPIPIVLKSLLEKPCLQDIHHIGDVPHAMGFGKSSYRPILENKEYSQKDLLINIIKGNGLKNFTYWTDGRKRYNELTNTKKYQLLEALSKIIHKISRCRYHGVKICTTKILIKLKLKNINY